LRQVLQSLKTGITEVADVPAPGVSRGGLLIHSTCTLVSSGTERMLVEFGKASLIGKARQQPARVQMALDKIATDGLLPTVEAVRNKLDQPLALGYCNVGVVAAVGEGVTGFTVGDRVVSNGKHAEVVSVPVNLCARIPDRVSDEHAAFTVLGSIALQGMRLVQPTLGETVVVTGLGLVGLLTVQLLVANGCRVLGLDFDPAKLALARQFGAETVDLAVGEDPVATAMTFSRGRGVDAVLITASTESDEPVHQAALMCRQRGRIVLVGVAGLTLSRDDFFKKELTFQVSSSYGPGRYDPEYEEKGRDYPFGLVRWTEQRNFEAVLDMLAAGRLDTGALISHRFPVTRADEAYALVSGGGQSLGILLEFPGRGAERSTRSVALTPAAAPSPGGVSFIGAGNYATAVLIPAFRDSGAALRIVASGAGVSALHAARKFGFATASTDTGQIFADLGTAAVVITTRHDTHARFAVQALTAGKHVFVEKPLCLRASELEDIARARDTAAARGSAPIVMVGFNRRFAPHVQTMKTLLTGVNGPKVFVMTVNAGMIAADHWTQDREVGGGRLLGEACHFVDLLRYLAGVRITRHAVSRMAAPTDDTATIQLEFADGSIGTVHYLANGSRKFPKERLDVFASGRVLQLDNFRKLTGFGWPDFKGMSLWRQDKGQRHCADAFLRAVRDGLPSPIPFDEIEEVSRVSLDIAAA
jgi:predicted dehydrogenase/threonine dehydrogenase-like Zn-dependent dehydrogenase